ncbi:4Fe-4S dicluster domain-containing protein [Bacteroides uniformis]|nr:4Fe-4S dicluster domain-containing protein [Bacteroides uniformis]
MPRLASDRLCTGCLVCVDTCKHQAIGIIKKNGLTHVSICSDKCVNCNLCEKACPIVSPVKKNDVSQMHAFGDWCKDDALRKKSGQWRSFYRYRIGFFPVF